MKSSSYFKIILAAFLLMLGFSSYAAKCKFKDKVVIGNFSWKSAQMVANIDKTVLIAMGCKVELIAGDTVTSFASMVEKGVPHVIPELWANNISE